MFLYTKDIKFVRVRTDMIHVDYFDKESAPQIIKLEELNFFELKSCMRWFEKMIRCLLLVKHI